MSDVITRLESEGEDVPRGPTVDPRPDDATERARVQAIVRQRLVGGDPSMPRIGRFHVLHTLGAGGMGTVYAAFDEQLDRRVAIKVIREDRRELTLRTLREAQSLARITHPNVISIYEVGEHHGALFLAMEFVQGMTLRQWVQHQPRSWREIWSIYRQAAHGLGAVHAAGLIHRDFKPENAIVGIDGRVRVLDFGLARRDDAGSTGARVDLTETALPPPDEGALDTPLTRTGTLMGTPAYMGPEQFLGEPSDPRTDEFSFCVSLFEALYGMRPFAGNTRERLIANVTSGRTLSPPKDTAVPAWFHAALLRGLAVEPSARWPSMAALVVACEADPARRRRRLGAIASLGLAAAVAIGGQRLAQAQAAARCDEAARAHAWTEDARERVRSGLLGSGAAYAESSLDRVSARLDLWAERWTDGRRGICDGGGAEPGLDAELERRAIACFDERNDRAAQVIDMIAVADASAATTAPTTAALLLDPTDRCSDPAWLERWPTPPTDTAAEVKHVRNLIYRSQLLRFAGHHRDGLEVALDAEQRAAALAWAPLTAEVAGILGIMRARTGDTAGAVADLERAFVIAGELGHDVVAVDAAIRLMGTSGRNGQLELGRRWGRLARALIQRGGQGELVPAMGMLEHNAGQLDQAAGDFEASRAHHERALVAWRQSLGDGAPEVAMVLVALASDNISLGDTDQALRQYQEGLEVTTAAYGPDHPQIATLHDGIGSAHAARGELDRALDSRLRALALRERVLAPGDIAIGESLQNLGALAYQAGRLDEAVDYGHRALPIFVAALGPESKPVGDVLNNLGNCHAARGDIDAAIRSYRDALAAYEASVGSEHADLVLPLTNLGGLQARIGALALGIPLLERAATLAERTMGPDRVVTIGAAVNLAMARIDHGEPSMALAALEEALARAEASFPDEAVTASARYGVGSALLELGRVEQALSQLERAHAWFVEHSHDPTELGTVRLRLARAIFATQGDKARAVALARQARDALRGGGPMASRELADAEAWLRAHGE